MQSTRRVLAASTVGLLLIAVESLAGCLPATHAGKSYSFCDDPLPWERASEACRSTGGQLVAIGDEDENAFVLATAQAAGFGGSLFPVWIGLFGTTPGGAFAWSSGAPVSFLDWASGQPPRAGGCAGILLTGMRAGQWSVGDCATQLGYVCEHGCGDGRVAPGLAGRYLISQETRRNETASTPVIRSIGISTSGAVWTEPGCGGTRGRWRRDRKGNRRVVVKFRSADCRRAQFGVRGRRRTVVFRARVDGSCGELRGGLKLGGEHVSFTARRSACGDGITDALVGEACDGGLPEGAVCPGSPTVDAAQCLECTAACRLQPTLVPVDPGRVSLYGSGRFAVLTVPAAEYSRWRVGDVDGATLQSTTASLYRTLDDAFDFVILVDDEEDIDPDAKYYGLHAFVRNDVSGFGLSEFDASAVYGSDVRLKGVIILTLRDALAGGPSLHEIMHQWANYLGPLLPGDDGGHWGFSSVGGQLGGWQYGTLVDLGGGLYSAKGPQGHTTFGKVANGGNSLPYAPLELYLMGLIEADEVTEPIQVADNASWVDASSGTFRASGIRQVTISDVIAAVGPRVPGPEGSQRQFRGLVVLVGAEEPTQDVLATFDADVERFSRPADDGLSYLFNFWEATGGRASMQMDGLFSTLH